MKKRKDVDRALITEARSGKYVYCEYKMDHTGYTIARLFLPCSKSKSEKYFVPADGFKYKTSAYDYSPVKIVECHHPQDKKYNTIITVRIKLYAWAVNDSTHTDNEDITIQEIIPSLLEKYINEEIDFYWFENR